MSPRKSNLKRRLHPGQVMVEDQAGFRYGVSRSQAAELIKDGVVRVVPHPGGGIKLQERPSKRAIYSSRYLQDRFSPGLRLYRDDLIKTVEQSKTTKPARAWRRDAKS